MMRPLHRTAEAGHRKGIYPDAVNSKGPRVADDELITRIRQRCLDLADGDARRSALYAELLRTIAGDNDLCGLIARARAGQRRPVLLLAAIHDTVLGEPNCDLAAWYASTNPATLRRPDDPALAGILRAHVTERRHTIEGMLDTRATQTNEIGRSAALLPALGEVARRSGRPIALFELGASAGLNLRPDMIRHELNPDGGGPISIAGASDSPATLEVTTFGSPPSPPDHLDIVARLGLDRDPLDATVASDRRWLSACVWPDDVDRAERLARAIDVAVRHPVKVVDGDLRHDVTAPLTQLAEAHPEASIVVWHSWVLTYVPRDERHLLADQLFAAGIEDLWWLSAEHPGVVAALPGEAPDTSRPNATVLGSIHLAGRQVRSAETWALLHPHGRWIDWIA